MSSTSTFDWQLKCSNYKQRATHLLNSGEWADCSLLLGTNKVPIAVHRLFLAMASPVFGDMFYGALGDATQPMEIPDVQPDVFKIILEYIYADTIKITNFKMAYSVYHAAEKFHIPQLTTASVAYLLRNVSARTAASTYEFAHVAGEMKLADKCMRIIKIHTDQVLNDPSFLRLKLDTVVEVFSQKVLNIDTEISLCEAAQRYLDAESLRKEVTPLMKIMQNIKRIKEETQSNPSEDDKDAVDTKYSNNCELTSEASVRSEDYSDDKTSLPIRKALQCVRFLTMCPQEFAEFNFTALLSQEDICAISLNIMSKVTHMPMPVGFSTSRKPREQVF